MRVILLFILWNHCKDSLLSFNSNYYADKISQSVEFFPILRNLPDFCRTFMVSNKKSSWSNEISITQKHSFSLLHHFSSHSSCFRKSPCCHYSPTTWFCNATGTLQFEERRHRAVQLRWIGFEILLAAPIGRKATSARICTRCASKLKLQMSSSSVRELKDDRYLLSLSLSLSFPGLLQRPSLAIFSL